MPIVLYDPEQAAPWERQAGESPAAFQAWTVYRDMRVGERSNRRTALELHKSKALIDGWSSKHNWVERAAAYDRELDRIARQAREDEIERINRAHVTMAQAMREQVERAMPRAGRRLEEQPHALQEWVKTLAKLERDAAGIQDPSKRVVVAGDPDAPVQIESSAIIANLPPELILEARDLAIKVAKAKAREQAVANMAIAAIPLPPVSVEDESSGA